MSSPSEPPLKVTPGAARLPVVIPVAIISFFYSAVLDYALPLYFSAQSAAASAGGMTYPDDLWSQLSKYQVMPWIIGPLVAGLCARRYGERIVWSIALTGQVLVPLALLLEPSPQVVPLLALWQGITGALMWIAGVSLIQMVPLAKKGLANGLMMAALGLGSVFGPMTGRLLLYRGELWESGHAGEWGTFFSRLLNFSQFVSTPEVPDFQVIFLMLSASTLFCGILVGGWGQHSGRFEHDPVPGWGEALNDLGRLVRISRFWALVITLCLLGGPVFQASNQFLPYRAEHLGLKSGSQDSGWIWLTLLKTLMWLPGGAAVGFLAGRRAPGVAAVLMVGTFSLMALGIGFSQTAWQLFASVAVFEFVRQFMRWSHAGYLSEHMPPGLRSTAIGCSITFSGLGSTIFGWLAAAIWDPTVDSRSPFFTAASLGGLAAVGLFVFDRFRPIREIAAKDGGSPVPQAAEFAGEIVS
ncbi:MAG: MFS transporter [Planctomycetaceae bacterium]|nr:MFS transporter [Planctomycetaceae bacterium]